MATWGSYMTLIEDRVILWACDCVNVFGSRPREGELAWSAIRQTGQVLETLECNSISSVVTRIAGGFKVVSS